MIKRAKDFFSSEGRTARFIFTILVVVAFGLVFGPTIYAQFVRTSGPVGFSYGYGYGANYGYGYGYLNGEVRTNNEDYGFLGNDGKATSVSVSTTATTMTVNYSTNYLAKNKIQYGLTTAMSGTSSESAFQTGANSITVSGLTCGVTHYYRVVSTDAGGNIWYSTPTFSITTTASCGSSGNVGGGGGGGGYSTPTPSSTPTSNPTPTPILGPVIIPTLPANPTNADYQNLVDALIRQLAYLRSLLGTQHGAYHFNVVLAFGDSGEGVRQLQIFLKAQGPDIYPEGLVTGYFGLLTQRAVQRFQAKYNIVSSGTPETTGYGLVGPLTRAKINALQGL